MKVSDLSKSRFLKKEDVDPPIDVTVTAVTHENVAMQGEKPDMVYVLWLKEVEKGLILNVTNGQFLEAITGSEYGDKWIGHKIQLWNDQSVRNPRTGKIGGVRIRRVGGHAADPTEEINRKFQEAEDDE